MNLTTPTQLDKNRGSVVLALRRAQRKQAKADIGQRAVTFMSSMESMGTPAMPTSPATRGWSES